tara:strand:- start:818 stop:1285 length:468 start_codon:yes stop_codon:yes gene_type:complete
MSLKYIDISSAGFPKNILWLGILGFLPFAIASAIPNFMPPEVAMQGKFFPLIHAAIILSFLDCILWVRVLAVDDAAGKLKHSRLLNIRFTSALLGCAVLSGPELGLPILKAAFLLFLYFELRGVKLGLFPTWYLSGRIHLTCSVIMLLLASVFFA